MTALMLFDAQTWVARTAAITVVAVLTAGPPVARPTRSSLSGAAPTAASDAAGPLTESWTPPLHTRGRYVVDANGNRFKLRSGNWHGASGTWTGSGDPADDANHHAAENSHRIPLGLDRAGLDQLVAGFEELGINSIRLQFSNEMLHDSRPVELASVRANPGLAGRTPLQVYDAVVDALTAAGLAVILNNHMNTTRWCCGIDGNERWNASQSVQTWEDDWLFLVRRYRSNPRVVGADLYNEVRRSVFDDPNWGLGDDHDWFAASQHLGDRILLEANPDLLIVVEGISWFGLPVDGFAHGRPQLEPVRNLSHTLIRSGKLVYSAHFYDYTGPRHTGATGLGETSDPRYRDLSRAELFDVLNRQAFYVAGESGQHFTAPVWISEFGIGRWETGQRQRAWFSAFVDYLIATDADFAYWPLVGWHSNRTGNGWALLHWDSAGQRMDLYDGEDWRAADWTRLIGAAGRTGPVEQPVRWAMLSPDHGDFIASQRLRGGPDYDVGARKAACPDDQRLAALSQTGNRGLCTDARAGSRLPGGGFELVVDERYVPPGGDWATGYTKLQCQGSDVMVGWSVRGSRVTGALCARSAVAATGPGRTVWFDRGDNRPPAAAGGDFAYGHYKGQCADAEYVAGVAFTNRLGSAGNPAAILCRP